MDIRMRLADDYECIRGVKQFLKQNPHHVPRMVPNAYRAQFSSEVKNQNQFFKS